MVNYRKILEYYAKGNNKTCIAIICDVSRRTVIDTIKRANATNFEISNIDIITDKELYELLLPHRGRNTAYLKPNMEKILFEKKKRHRTFRKAWEIYCKRAEEQNLKAYSIRKFYMFYREYLLKPINNEKTEIEKKLIAINIAIENNKNDEELYSYLLIEKETFLRTHHLQNLKM